MSPLVSPIGRALNTGSNEHRKRHRALQETKSHSGGIQNRRSPREGIETDTSVVSAARKHGSGIQSPGVMWTPNQDAQGSASPDGVERAVPDQDQAVMAAARRTNWRTTMVSPRPCASSGRGRRFWGWVSFRVHGCSPPLPKAGEVDRARSVRDGGATRREGSTKQNAPHLAMQGVMLVGQIRRYIAPCVPFGGAV
jgi:hypothetical protein